MYTVRLEGRIGFVAQYNTEHVESIPLNKVIKMLIRL